RHAVRDDGRFERHDRAALGERGLHFRLDLQQLVLSGHFHPHAGMRCAALSTSACESPGCTLKGLSMVRAATSAPVRAASSSEAPESSRESVPATMESPAPVMSTGWAGTAGRIRAPPASAIA